MTMVTATDPEPALGAVVRDALGRLWMRMDADDCGGPGRANWIAEDASDPETWVKVAGNYGPVVLVLEGSEAAVEARRRARLILGPQRFYAGPDEPPYEERVAALAEVIFWARGYPGQELPR